MKKEAVLISLAALGLCGCSNWYYKGVDSEPVPSSEVGAVDPYEKNMNPTMGLGWSTNYKESKAFREGIPEPKPKDDVESEEDVQSGDPIR